jgi:hypothetical protein
MVGFRMRLVLFALMVILVESTALALDDGKDPGYLSARSAELSCMIDFHIAVMQGIEPMAPELGAFIGRLRGDKTAISTLAETGDLEDFRKSVNRIIQDMNDAKNATRDARRNIRGNASEKRSSYAEAEGLFKSCQDSISLSLASAKLAYVNRELEWHEKIIINISYRSIDTYDMTAIMYDARTAIAGPLKAAIESNDPAQAMEAVRKFCLYDGCKDGVNFHLAARLSQARLLAVMKRVEPGVIEFKGTTGEIKGHIFESMDALREIGTSDYAKGDKDAVWDPLKKAMDMMKRLKEDLSQTISKGGAYEVQK